MAEKQTIDAMWDDSPVDVSTEVNFIWSIANKLRGTYQSDKYKDVIIPMVIIRRFECALAPTKQKVVDQFRANPAYPAKAMYRVSGYQFYNTSKFNFDSLLADPENIVQHTLLSIKCRFPLLRTPSLWRISELLQLAVYIGVAVRPHSGR